MIILSFVFAWSLLIIYSKSVTVLPVNVENASISKRKNVPHIYTPFYAKRTPSHGNITYVCSQEKGRGVINSVVGCIFIENQQMDQNDNFIVMLSQTLLHVSAYQHHHQGTRMFLTSYLYVGVH
jgi:hypothetical protein